MTSNGRYVAFVSSASIDDGVGEGNEGVCDPPGPDEAEPGQGSETRDQNGTKLDVYVFNRDADGNGIFDEAVVPRTGGLKSFCGVSTDLVSVDSNESQGQNVSKSVSVEPGIAISANGRYVAFATGSQFATGDTNNKVDVYLRDRDTDADGIYDEPESSNTIWVSGGSINAPNGASLSPSVSDDGSLVAFESTATNLAAGPGANGAGSDIFVKNVKTGVMTRITERGGCSHGAVALRQRRARRVPARHRRDRDRQRRHDDHPGDPPDQDRHEARARERRQLVRLQRGPAGVRHQRHRRRDRAHEHARRRHRGQRRIRRQRRCAQRGRDLGQRRRRRVLVRRDEPRRQQRGRTRHLRAGARRERFGLLRIGHARSRDRRARCRDR